MKTAPIWAALALIAALQVKTSLTLAGHITDALGRGLEAVQLHAAASAVQHPARMVWLARGEAGKAARDGAAFTPVTLNPAERAHPPAGWSLEGSPARLRPAGVSGSERS